jgi:hypothetical protein
LNTCPINLNKIKMMKEEEKLEINISPLETKALKGKEEGQ